MLIKINVFVFVSVFFGFTYTIQALPRLDLYMLNRNVKLKKNLKF
jgi:hypothetical protein